MLFALLRRVPYSQDLNCRGWLYLVLSMIIIMPYFVPAILRANLVIAREEYDRST